MAMRYCQPTRYRTSIRRQYSAVDEYDDDFIIEDCATDEDNVLIFDKVKEIYGVRNIDDAALKRSADSREIDNAEKAFEEEINKLNDNEQRSCASCATQVRVVSTSSFKKGQHIAKLGDHFRTHVKLLRKQVCPYDHHMIVKEVKTTTKNTAEVTLIHFARSERDNRIKICEDTKTFDLRYDEIYLVEYPRPKYFPSEVVQRAESILDTEKKYNVFTSNCEHFATWCIVGEGKSLQVQGLREQIKNAVFGVLGKSSIIARGMIRLLLNSSDEISATLTKAASVPGLVLSGMAGLYLIYCIFMTVLHTKDYKQRNLCWSCWKKKILDLWLAFAVFGATSGIQYILFTFALPLIPSPVGIPLIIVVILLSVALQKTVPKITSMLRSPFSDEGKEVKVISEIDIGDIVQLKYKLLDHIVLVTEVHEGRIRCIHYAAPTFPLGGREVKEEYFSINLKESKVKVIGTKFMKCYAPNVAVKRGRERLGERKFDALSNRSSHLCFWAKADLRSDASEELDYGELGVSECKDLSSLRIEKKEIHLITELELGDVVSIGNISIGNHLFMQTKGILVNIRGDRKGNIKLELLVYKRMKVLRERCSVDLRNTRVFVHKYLAGHCKTMIERKRSAERMEDSFHFYLTTDGFIKDCIMLDP